MHDDLPQTRRPTLSSHLETEPAILMEEGMQLAHITVNTPTLTEEYAIHAPGRTLEAAMNEINIDHPDWTSLIVIYLREETDHG